MMFLQISSSEAMGDILDMDPSVMSEDPMFVDFVAGNHVLEGSIPISHRYGGHQFGVWVILIEFLNMNFQ